MDTDQDQSTAGAAPHDTLPEPLHPSQAWTLDGYPIVDGKYHDLATDEIKTHTGPSRGGPPSTSVYWQNRASVSRSDQFFAMGAISRHSVTDYLARVGEMLKEGRCTVTSLNATEYAVNVIIVTQLTTGEFTHHLQRHGLIRS